MKIILQKDIEKVGKEGDVVTVADGYARNYLFPRKLAVAAIGGALKNIQMKQALEERRSEKIKAAAEQSAIALTDKSVTITARAGAGDRLYGSITSGDIVDAVQKSLGVTVDRRKVQLLDPIKAMGSYTVPVKLHRDITVPIKVEVVRADA